MSLLPTILLLWHDVVTSLLCCLGFSIIWGN